MDVFMQGTRQRQGFDRSTPSTRDYEQGMTRDVGLNKNVTVSATFSLSAGQIQALSGNFSAFAKDDLVRATGTANNDGEFLITAVGVSGASLTVVPAPKQEGPITSVIRTL